MRENRPILVVGAGPTGMTMACELSRHGATVRIIDKLPGIIPYCRATGIHSRTLEIFQDLGIVDEVIEKGLRIQGVNQYANGKRFQHFAFEEVDSPYPFTVTLEQYHTEAILEKLLNILGVSIERETELIAMTDRLDGVLTTLRHANGHQEQFETPWMIACDGARSQVRHLNHQRFPGETDSRQYALADVIVDAPIAQDELHFFMSDQGTLFMFPLPAGRTLVVSDVSGQHDAARETPTLQDMQVQVSSRGRPDAQIRSERWLSYFHINYRITRHYRHGRTFLAGDAAHIHSPLGGQGMNTGIQDAHNLAWKLALVYRGDAPSVLLESYEKERHAVAVDVLETTRRATEYSEGFTKLSSSDRERLYFHAAVPEIERIRSLRHDQELDLDYRKSPICSDSLNHQRQTNEVGPHAGAETPDAGPIQVGNRILTLFQLLRGTRHSLLLFVGEQTQESSRTALTDLAIQVLQSHGQHIAVYLVEIGSTGSAAKIPSGVSIVYDPEQALHHRYGASTECLYLIRPDGYVGFQSRPARLREFRQYLDKIFIPSSA